MSAQVAADLRAAADRLRRFGGIAVVRATPEVRAVCEPLFDRGVRDAPTYIAALLAAADAAEAPDCIHISSCEPGDHTRSWPCDYAPGTGKYAADAAEADQ